MDTQGELLDKAEIAAISRRIDRPIVLVGLMGVGKSTVGRKIAELTDRSFVDADAAIEEAAQLSVAEIFESYGEQVFRDGERRVIARLIEEDHGIIATGGGAFVDPQTRALILEKAIGVWIDCDIDTLVERTSRRKTRPLLNQGNPAETLARLHKERAPLYSEAQVRVLSENSPHIQTATMILKAIDRWL